MLARWFNVADILSRPQRFLQTILAGGLLPAAFGATLGSLVLSLAGLADISMVWPAWLLGSVFGYLAILPLGCFVLYHRTVAPLSRPTWSGSALMLVLLASALIILELHPQPYMLALIPLLVVLYVAPPIEGALAGWLLGFALAWLESREWAQALVQGVKVLVLPDLLPNLAILLAYAVLIAQAKAHRLAMEKINHSTLELALALEQRERAMRDLNDALQAAGLARFWVWPAQDSVQFDAIGRQLFGFESAAETVQCDVAAYFERIHPDDRARVRASWDKVQSDHGTINYRVQLPNGQTRWIEGLFRQRSDAQGHLQQRWGFHRDVTERERQTQAMATLQAEQQTVLDAASVGLLHVRDNRIVWANPELGRMLGTTERALAGQSTRSLYFDDAAYERGVGWVREQLKAGFEVLSGEVALRHADGSLRLLELRGKPIDATHFDAIYAMRDITEERAQAQAMAEALVAAKAGEKAKSDFLSVISHEIRTPLNGVMGMLQIAQFQDDAKQATRPYVDEAYKSSQLLLTVLNDVLDMSGLQNGRMAVLPAPMRLSELHAYLEQLRNSLVFQHDVRFDTSALIEPDLLLSADALRLKQIILNLVNNAVKFTEHGSVKASIVLQKHDAHSARVDLVVADTGIGMSPETQVQLFKPFMQADMGLTRQYGGTGLGLSIVKGLLEQMGGTITVHSQRGVGSQFTVELVLPVLESTSEQPAAALGGVPKADELARLQALRHSAELAAERSTQVQAAQARDAELQEPAFEVIGALKGIHVLVVEDDVGNAKVERMMLETAGAVVTLAHDALVGLQLMAEPPMALDVVLMDLQMPHMSGLEAVRILRASDDARLRALPVVGLSGNIMRGEPEQAIEAGMNAFLAKPASLEAQVRAILQVLGRS